MIFKQQFTHENPPVKPRADGSSSQRRQRQRLRSDKYRETLRSLYVDTILSQAEIVEVLRSEFGDWAPGLSQLKKDLRGLGLRRYKQVSKESKRRGSDRSDSGDTESNSSFNSNQSSPRLGLQDIDLGLFDSYPYHKGNKAEFLNPLGDLNFPTSELPLLFPASYAAALEFESRYNALFTEVDCRNAPSDTNNNRSLIKSLFPEVQLCAFCNNAWPSRVG